MNSLSIFFPCFNDEETIQELVLEAEKFARAWTRDYEILVVDDGSRDQSRKILKGLEEKISHLRLIFHEKNIGYGGALCSGFENASKEWVFYTDGDGQYDLADLPLFLKSITPGVDMITGYKLKRADAWYRVLGSKVYNALVRFAFGLRCRDINGDFRLIRRRIFDRIRLKTSSGAVGVELFIKAERLGCRIIECPVRHRPRRYGRSQFFRPSRIWETFTELCRLWLEFRT